jgi:DNA-binding transcriptional LysR family regulator
MDVRHLRYFLAVADELHFGRAAQRLHMSQPPLSARIKGLERELGIVLFDRTSRGVRLTDAGRRLLPAARRAVEAFDDARCVAENARSIANRTIRVGLPPDTSQDTIETFTRTVHDQDPDLNPYIYEATTAQQLDALRRREFDLGVVRHPVQASGLVMSTTLSAPAGATMAPGHPLARCESVSIADMNDYPLILFPRSVAPGLYDETVAVLTNAGLRPVRIENVVRLASALLITENAIAVRNQAAVHSAELVWRPLTGDPLTWRTSVAWARRTNLTFLPLCVEALNAALVRHDKWTRETPAPPATH